MQHRGTQRKWARLKERERVASWLLAVVPVGPQRRASRLVALPIVVPTDTSIRLSLFQCTEPDTRLPLVPAQGNGLTGAQND